MSAVGKAFNKVLNVVGMGVPDMPDIEKPKEAPVSDDDQRRIAAEREAMRKRRGRGRAATILTENSKLG